MLIRMGRSQALPVALLLTWGSACTFSPPAYGPLGGADAGVITDAIGANDDATSTDATSIDAGLAGLDAQNPDSSGDDASPSDVSAVDGAPSPDAQAVDAQPTDGAASTDAQATDGAPSADAQATDGAADAGTAPDAANPAFPYPPSNGLRPDLVSDWRDRKSVV